MIDLSKTGDLWTVTLNRPEKANALTREMLTALADHAEAAAGQAKVFVLTGTGGAFSAGMDLGEAEAGLATDPVWERLSGAIAAMPALTIAALNGTAAGGSLGMVLACDLRLAVPKANIFYPVMKLGFLPQPSDPKRLIALVGPARAKRILMAGEKIGAGEAQRWGLIDHIVDPGEMEAKLAALSADALSADAVHIAGIKSLFKD